MKNRAGELLAFLIISIAVLMILNDAYKIKNGWMHPETVVWTAKYLLNDIHEKIGLSFHPEEITKIFWWEQYIDFGLTRFDTAAFQLIDAKFRTWLFQYIPPNPAVSLSWLFTLFFIPLLLFRFLRRHIKLGVIGSAAITVLYLASPATASLTFLNYHPGKMLPLFFILLSFHFCIILNERALSHREPNSKSLRGIFILLGITLFISLYSDPMVFIVCLLIPLFFPRLISNGLSVEGEKAEPLITLEVSYHRTKRKLNIVNIVTGSNRYYLSLVYLIVFAVFFLSVYYIIPHLAYMAGGYSYKFMQASETFGGGIPLYTWLVSAKYYMAVIANMYWLIIGGVGVRDYFPLYINGPSLIINYHSVALFLIVNLIIIGIGLISYKASSKNKLVLAALIAVYITTAWITLIQSQQGFYLPYSNYFYGSLFSVPFAIFLGAALVSFKEHKKIYVAFIAVILAASFFTYKGAKGINAGWKGGHYRGNDIDGFYKEQIEYWRDLKDKKVDFDMNICGNISKELNYSITHRDALITYGVVQEGIAFNKDNVKAINFAAFCGDNHLKTTNGIFAYEPRNLEKIELTEAQLKTSSSYETRGSAIDGDKETYWHLKFPKEEKIDAFIEMDMGAKRSVKVLRILPRRGSIDQLWDGGNAVWEGSDGRGMWNTITRLNVDRAKLKNDEWIGFVLPQDEGRIYRYYRLRIRYGSFLSLAEIELYRR